MNNDKINRLKESYFSGKSSKEEEKWLKENANDAYFNTLKEEQKEEMSWEFDDFLATVEQEEPVKKIGSFSFRKMTYWAAASVALIVFGTFMFMQSNNIGKPQHAKQDDAPQVPVTEPTKNTEDIPAEKRIEDEIQFPRKKTEKRVPQPQKEAQLPVEEQPTYNPEYVVINGKPIYDLEEARELTMNSLNLLASNVEKSVSGMENIKHLSIKF